VWTGAAAETPWTSPLRPIGQEVFGVGFRVDLAPDADQLAYTITGATRRTPAPTSPWPSPAATSCGSSRASIPTGLTSPPPAVGP
jgi:hypothetical protein